MLSTYINWHEQNAQATTDEERARLDVRGEYHTGEFINVFAKGSLVMQVCGITTQPQHNCTAVVPEFHCLLHCMHHYHHAYHTYNAQCDVLLWIAAAPLQCFSQHDTAVSMITHVVMLIYLLCVLNCYCTVNSCKSLTVIVALAVHQYCLEVQVVCLAASSLLHQGYIIYRHMQVLTACTVKSRAHAMTCVHRTVQPWYNTVLCAISLRCSVIQLRMHAC
jgi:hypothetical protein